MILNSVLARDQVRASGPVDQNQDAPARLRGKVVEHSGCSGETDEGGMHRLSLGGPHELEVRTDLLECLRVQAMPLGAVPAYRPVDGSCVAVTDQWHINVAVVVQRRCGQFRKGGRRPGHHREQDHGLLVAPTRLTGHS